MLDGFGVIYGGAPACVTVTVAETPPPLIVMLPLRELVLVLASQDKLKSKKPYPLPVACIQVSFELILKSTVEDTSIVVLPEPYPKDILEGLAVIFGVGGAPACVTDIVAEVPPPLIVTLPLREFVLVLATQDKTKLPLPDPLPAAIIQLSFGLTLQLTLEDTSIV